jgi:hypothetical protein
VVVLARAVAPLTGAGSDRVAQVAALPTMHFPNGHIFFTARLPQREGIKPYAVHCTYQHPGQAISISVRALHHQLHHWTHRLKNFFEEFPHGSFAAHLGTGLGLVLFFLFWEHLPHYAPTCSRSTRPA